MTTPIHAHARSHADAEIWLDGPPSSLARSSLARARFGAELFSGMTTNPRLLLDDALAWLERLRGSHISADALARAARAAAVGDAAASMSALFERSGGRQGWTSAQVDPRAADDSAAMIREGRELASLAANVMVKLPATSAGLVAARVLAERGVAINITLSTTATQARLALEAIAVGLERQSTRAPWRAVLTFMVGRLGAAISAAHGPALRPGDARRVELLAIAVQDALVRASGTPVELLLCSLRADDEDDRALGCRASHLAFARGQPWILTCPVPLLERCATLPASAAAPSVGPKDARRLRALDSVAAALDPHGLDDAALREWPALRENLAQHLSHQRTLLQHAAWQVSPCSTPHAS